MRRVLGSAAGAWLLTLPASASGAPTLSLEEFGLSAGDAPSEEQAGGDDRGRGAHVVPGGPAGHVVRPRVGGAGGVRVDGGERVVERDVRGHRHADGADEVD